MTGHDKVWSVFWEAQGGMANSKLAAIRIVLVEPAGPLNVGAIARVMKNFGLQHLVLVNPQCDPLGSEARQMAVHAQELLTTATRVNTLPEALVGCQRAIATTARSRHFEAPLELPEIGLPWLLAGTTAALIFGPEDRGLNNQELCQAQRYLKIPTDDDYPALNLAQAVSVCSYELFRLVHGGAAASANISAPASLQTAVASDRSSATGSLAASSDDASLDDLEGYYHHLESVLLKIGYLYPHTAASRMRKIRRLCHRAAPASSEVALLRGILSQVEWALNNPDAVSSPD
jgi:tRNA/rRNA methyltransferase